MLFLDPLYILLIFPGLALSLWATFRVKSAFGRWSRVPVSSGVTGAEAAAWLLRQAGVEGVRIERVGGMLTDHYDPVHRVLRLSPDVYSGRSVAAVAVACHEAGHAIQHARAYLPLHLRSWLVPATQFATNTGYIVMLLGFLLHFFPMILWGALLTFGLTLVFQLVTLPVEFDASRRAKELALRYGLVQSPGERKGMEDMLSAAALTYVAAAVTTLLTLGYYLLRFGGMGEER